MALKITRRLSPARLGRKAVRRAVRRPKRKVKAWWRGERVKIKPARGSETTKKAAGKRSAAARTVKAKPAAQRAAGRASQRTQRTGRAARMPRAVARGTVPVAALSAYATTGPAAMQLGTVSDKPGRRNIPTARRAACRGDCPWCRGLRHAPLLTPALPCQPCNGTGRAHPGMARPTGRYRATVFEAWEPDVELAHSAWFTEDPVAAQEAAAQLVASLIRRNRPASVLHWRIEHRP